MKDKGTFGNREKINESIEERGIGYIRKGFSELITKRNPDYDTHLMRVICDHISGMTDSYALNIYEQLY